MDKKTVNRNPLVIGTFLLTCAGLLSRVIGFFYRIFLSHTIGAEGLGIYQLIFPVLALSISLTASGIQTSISKYCATEFARKNSKKARTYLIAGFTLSITLSTLCSIAIRNHADWIAISYLKEKRCLPLLQIMAYSLPFSSIHSCIMGYYYGQKKAAVPAISQLLEQIVRVATVYIIFLISTEQHQDISPQIAVWGIVSGEIIAALFSVSALGTAKHAPGYLSALKEISLFSLPLTANRVTLNFFQSMEALLIPDRLRLFGYTTKEALSTFGILTGMALPMILFPNVITNSVSVLLLPAVSEAKEKQNQDLIFKTIKKTIESCMILGLFSTAFFLCFGHWIGEYLFGNTLAGTFIVTLSWICPFLFLSTTLSSILHGLGKPTTTFLLNLCGCGIRIFCIYIFIPRYGIRAYLLSMLFSQIVISALAVFILCKPHFYASNNLVDK